MRALAALAAAMLALGAAMAGDATPATPASDNSTIVKPLSSCPLGAPILDDASTAPLAVGAARALQGWAPRVQTSFDVADWNAVTGPSLFSVLISYITAEGVVTVGDTTVDTDCYTATWENAAGACVYWNVTVLCEASAGAQGCPIRQEFNPLGAKVCQGPTAPSPPPPSALRQLPAGTTCDALKPLCDAQCEDAGATEALFSCYATNNGGQYQCTCDGESYELGDAPSSPSPPPARGAADRVKTGTWAWILALMGIAVLLR